MSERIDGSSETETLVGARELARVLGVSAASVRTWTRAGRIPHYRLGRGAYERYRYRVSEVLAAMRETSEVIRAILDGDTGDGTWCDDDGAPPEGTEGEVR